MISNMNKYQISKSPTLERLNLGNSIEGLKNKERGQRIWEIDFLRGFFFFGVILYHFAWDFTFFPTLFSNWYEMSSIYVGLNSLSRICNEILRKDYMIYFVNFFSGGFLFITGVSCSLSHSNLLRSIKISLVALLITLVTYLGSITTGDDMTIIFGILHCMGLSLLIYSIFELICKYIKIKISPWVLLIIGLGMTGYGMYIEYATVYRVYSTAMLTPSIFMKVILGFAYTYNDDFGLLPNMGKILVGIAIGKWLYDGKRGKKSVLPKLDGKWNKPVCLIGRHTFLVYIIHQPIIWIVVISILFALGYRISI